MILMLLAISIVTYVFNVLKLTLERERKIKIRRLITKYNMHHPKEHVNQLYLPKEY